MGGFRKKNLAWLCKSVLHFEPTPTGKSQMWSTVRVHPGQGISPFRIWMGVSLLPPELIMFVTLVPTLVEPLVAFDLLLEDAHLKSST